MGKGFAFGATLQAGRWVCLVGVVAPFVLAASAFLPHQTLWSDETVQMSGLELGPTRVVWWLVGAENPDFDQYPDRTPPLSYWLGWGWSRIFGLSETSMRWFGVTCVTIAVALVYESGRRAYGVAIGTTAGLIFGLSPQVIIMAVEIRAYPLFLLWSASALLFTVQLLMHASVRDAARDANLPKSSRSDCLAFVGLALSLSGADCQRISTASFSRERCSRLWCSIGVFATIRDGCFSGCLESSV